MCAYVCGLFCVHISARYVYLSICLFMCVCLNESEPQTNTHCLTWPPDTKHRKNEIGWRGEDLCVYLCVCACVRVCLCIYLHFSACVLPWIFGHMWGIREIEREREKWNAERQQQMMRKGLEVGGELKGGVEEGMAEGEKSFYCWGSLWDRQ